MTVDIEPPPADEFEDLDRLRDMRECHDTFGAPISVRQALDSMRREGLTVGRAAKCSLGFASFENANVAREGGLSCFLYESSPPDAPTTVRRRGADGADAELALHNLECTILADSPTGEERIDKLEAAFAELERTTRP